MKFKLSDAERQAFKRTVGHKINEDLPFTIEISKQDIKFYIRKRAYGGKGKLFINKINEICKFISDHLSPVFIPAIRPADTTVDVIESLLSYRLNRKLRDDSEYKNAIDVITKIQKREIDLLQKDLKDTINIFIPNIKSIELERGFLNIVERGIIREIKVDDGIKTSIYEKGEGLQSLISLGVMQRSHKNNSDLILVIDEPESHLHPEAIRKVKESLLKIAKNGQVIIATHSPILVNRDILPSNIIVANNKAISATKISDIRGTLGVSVSDNLVNAEYVLLVEGDIDKYIISRVLCDRSLIISKAIENGRLVIKPIRGAKNFVTERNWLQTFVCKGIRVYLDHDKAAHEAVETAKGLHLTNDKEIIYAAIGSKKESELEDLLCVEAYKELLPIDRVPNWQEILFNNANKWSDNITHLFDLAANPDFNLEDFKWKILECIRNKPNILDEKKIKSLKALQSSLECMLETK